ncbi:MAG: energy transducer TonB [Deltaproteobacteria bacterium]|nr:energy transducer TonB [Deltaproteobacteria bacterium]
MAAAKSQRPDPKQQASAKKILRIGVIQAGKIVEERLIRRRENVTIGASPRNTLVVPASTLPRTFTLFELQGDSYHLLFSETMDGRVSVNDQVMSLDQVRSGGHAKPARGGALALALGEGSRGKVLLGEVTLLFQFVAPPPIQPRPQLPPSVRGSFVTQMDWVLASSYAATTVLTFGLVFYLQAMDIPKKAAIDVVPDDFAEYLPAVKKPKTLNLAKLAKKTGEKQAKKAAVTRKTSSGSSKSRKSAAKPCDAACQAQRAAARRARLAKQVASLGALKLLGTKGAGSGTTTNLLAGGDPGRKLDNAFKGVSGLRAGGRRGGGLRAKGGGGTGRSADIGSLASRVGGPGKVGTGTMVDEKVPRAIVKRQTPKVDGTLDKNSLYRELRGVARGVTTCYQRALKRNPGLRGKISVRIEINTMGRVGSVEFDEDSIGDPGVASCVKATVRRQRFTPPKDGAAEVVVPFVFESAK